MACLLILLSRSCDFVRLALKRAMLTSSSGAAGTDKAAKQAAPKVKSNAVAQAPQATQASVEPQTPVKVMRAPTTPRCSCSHRTFVESLMVIHTIL